jgi:hypothetical protein
MPEPIRIDILSRPGCHLCDEAAQVIERFRGGIPVVIRTINVESSAELESQYGMDIPVVMVNGNEAFRHRVNGPELERKLKSLWNLSTS